MDILLYSYFSISATSSICLAPTLDSITKRNFPYIFSVNIAKINSIFVSLLKIRYTILYDNNKRLNYK